MINYKIDILSYVANNSVKSDCADITFYNTGSSPVTINNGIVLSQNQSLTINANENETDRTIYNFAFDDTISPKNLTVFRKVYI